MINFDNAWFVDCDWLWYWYCIGDADERCQIKMHYMAGSRGNLRQWLVDLLHRSSTAGVGFHDVTTYLALPSVA